MILPTVELNPDTFINRELSTLQFQRRVLALANDPNIPLLERVKFVAIVGSNLDEFFMVRVAAYIQKIKLGTTTPRPDGFTPQALLRRIRQEVMEIIEEQRRLMVQLFAELEQHGIYIKRFTDLPSETQAALDDYFNEQVFPVLTPLAVDHARPFPFISNLSLNLGVMLERTPDDDPEFARIKVPVPDILPRLINVNKVVERYAGTVLIDQVFIYVEDLIMNNLDDLFPGMRVLEATPFRVLRDADIDYEHENEHVESTTDDEDDPVDVMAIIERGVKDRRFGSLVRVSVPHDISQEMLSRLLDGLEVRPDSHLYMIEGALGSANLFELTALDRPDLKYPPYLPKLPEGFTPEVNIFQMIRRGDLLLHHPYDSFLPVEEFFRQAALDPDVLAIKTTLYRVGKNSPVVQALMEAHDNLKQVTVLVELKARFDEENNLTWARMLDAKGVHVIYGVEELPVKTHAKVSLVVRREDGGVRRYLHLGTGNYNASTARLYSDIGLFTADPQLADDASRLFNRLTGYAPATSYQRLLVAPRFLLPSLIELIDHEIAAAREGKPARLIFKMNQLEEDKMILKLYEASQAGVQVDLIVRGLCCLRPGVPGVSENIRVRSIVGRYLEHGRVFYFQNAPEDRNLYAGSADLMRRNLYNRVEVVFPILEPRLKTRIMRMLMTNLRDNQSAWELQSDGEYRKVQPQPDEPLISTHDVFMQNSWGVEL
ncbi:polyphosphate kinase 1 [Aggregatilineales bacterium SYSU G02658]